METPTIVVIAISIVIASILYKAIAAKGKAKTAVQYGRKSAALAVFIVTVPVLSVILRTFYDVVTTFGTLAVRSLLFILLFGIVVFILARFHHRKKS